MVLRGRPLEAGRPGLPTIPVLGVSGCVLCGVPVGAVLIGLGSHASCSSGLWPAALVGWWVAWGVGGSGWVFDSWIVVCEHLNCFVVFVACVGPCLPDCVSGGCGAGLLCTGLRLMPVDAPARCGWGCGGVGWVGW